MTRLFNHIASLKSGSFGGRKLKRDSHYLVELKSLRALIFDIKVSLLEMNQISFEGIWVFGKSSQGIEVKRWFLEGVTAETLGTFTQEKVYW